MFKTAGQILIHEIRPAFPNLASNYYRLGTAAPASITLYNCNIFMGEAKIYFIAIDVIHDVTDPSHVTLCYLI